MENIKNELSDLYINQTGKLFRQKADLNKNIINDIYFTNNFDFNLIFEYDAEIVGVVQLKKEIGFLLFINQT